MSGNRGRSARADIDRLRESRLELQEAARGAYTGGNGEAQLIDSNVAFVDLLGASELMEQLDDLQLRKLLTAMRANVDFFDPWYAFEGPARALTFSDNVAACLPVDETEIDGGLAWHVISAGAFQRNLTLNGFFVRGGITRGPVYADDSMIIGKALVDAYRLESQTRFPRVELDRDHVVAFALGCIEWANVLESTQNLCALVDSGTDTDESAVFVNYLEFFTEADDEEEFHDCLRTHRDLIIDRLGAFAGHTSVGTKYRWVAEYHNWACEQWFHLDEYLISPGGDWDGATNRSFTPLIQWMKDEAGWDFDELKRQRFGHSS